jgi:hypothetical protein
LTDLWYNGTDVDKMALPNPAMIRPIIIIANPAWPLAPVMIAAPTQVMIAPVRAAYLRPRRSLRKPERKT